MQEEGEGPTTDIAIVHPGSSLIVTSSQPGQSDVRSPTKPGTSKKLLTSIQREPPGFENGSRRFMAQRKAVCTSGQAQKAYRSWHEDCRSHEMVNYSSSITFGRTGRPLQSFSKKWSKHKTLQSRQTLRTVLQTFPFVLCS